MVAVVGAGLSCRSKDFGIGDSEFFEQAVELAAVDPQGLGGPRLVATDAAENLDDFLPLK